MKKIIAATLMTLPLAAPASAQDSSMASCLFVPENAEQATADQIGAAEALVGSLGTPDCAPVFYVIGGMLVAVLSASGTTATISTVTAN